MTAVVNRPREQVFALQSTASAGGQRMCIHHAPPGAQDGSRVKGALLHVHAFADEMNKSRRMCALQSRSLAEAGFAVLRLDLFGCGDSSGEWEDASWDTWLDDIQLGLDWLSEAHPAVPLWLWGQRAGCLLAAQAAARMSGPARFLFWQPPSNGEVLLNQFLRFKLAADMAGGQGRAELALAREDLALGRAVEVAGYRLPAAVARGLSASRLTPPAVPSTACWFEMSAREDGTLLPATQAAAQAWQAAGHQVEARAVPGPAFWITQEIEDAPVLISATTDALARSGRAAMA